MKTFQTWLAEAAPAPQATLSPQMQQFKAQLDQLYQQWKAMVDQVPNTDQGVQQHLAQLRPLLGKVGDVTSQMRQTNKTA